MISQKKLNQNVKEEFMKLTSDPLTTFGLTVGLIDKNNILNWKITLLGAGDTSYKGFFFI